MPNEKNNHICWLLLFTEDVKEATNSDIPDNSPQYTTVYVGNLAPEVRNFRFHVMSHSHDLFIPSKDFIYREFFLFQVAKGKPLEYLINYEGFGEIIARISRIIPIYST